MYFIVSDEGHIIGRSHLEPDAFRRYAAGLRTRRFDLFHSRCLFATRRAAHEFMALTGETYNVHLFAPLGSEADILRSVENDVDVAYWPASEAMSSLGSIDATTEVTFQMNGRTVAAIDSNGVFRVHVDPSDTTTRAFIQLVNEILRERGPLTELKSQIPPAPPPPPDRRRYIDTEE